MGIGTCALAPPAQSTPSTKRFPPAPHSSLYMSNALTFPANLPMSATRCILATWVGWYTVASVELEQSAERVVILVIAPVLAQLASLAAVELRPFRRRECEHRVRRR